MKRRTNPPADVFVNARVSVEEKADICAVVAAWEADAEAAGYTGHGFSEWLRAIVRREKRVLEERAAGVATGGRVAR